MAEAYGILGDIHIPFHLKDTIPWILKVKRDYKILDKNMYSVGDLLDLYFASMHKHSPNARHSPLTEIEESKRYLKKFYKAFPQLKIATSNHELRWYRKAAESGIPDVVLKEYKELIGAPKGWQYKDLWKVKGSKHTFGIIHGTGYSGQLGHVKAAMNSGMSMVIGHLHSYGAINYIKTDLLNIWAANAGCLIDNNQYAFQYAKYCKNKPTLGMIVVLDGGRMPIFVPYEG